ncbi:hypothetical protein EZ449_02705 [Pedobacter frigidisoli]|uniref:Uncharacterized protein n=1 Tax=Pedobacter frigidisoli TaxID=2530455 RepID=A0A4R0PAV3_9SPHI|nr:hypothetical protein [Pedobacter frigidisoli]TCD12974.1 hypothetical protein EZ449_02705 [Pedobacter frigidisoli]
MAAKTVITIASRRSKIQITPLPLFGGSSGWAPYNIGICHAEVAHALEISQRQVTIVDIFEFVLYPSPVPLQAARDVNFNSYLLEQNRFNHPFKLYDVFE